MRLANPRRSARRIHTAPPPAKRRVSLWIRALDVLTCFNLCLVAGWWILLWGVSERWWVGTALTYLPRSPGLLPALFLLGLSLVTRRWRESLVNLSAVGMVLWPIMGLQGNPVRVLANDPKAAHDLCVVSCNVQTFRPNFALVLGEISRINPDVVAFQEAFTNPQLLQDYFRDWHVARVDEYFLASKFPVKHVATCHCAAFDRNTAAQFEVATPQGPVTVFSIHPTSPRHGLVELSPWSLVTGAGVRRVERLALLRDEEARATRDFTREADSAQPFLVVGDFNMPTDSCFFQAHWGDLQDAYKKGAFGYGYTSPCSTRRLWPHNFPWLQVDHILTSKHWETNKCWVGKSAGSDHRLIAAKMKLR